MTYAVLVELVKWTMYAFLYGLAGTIGVYIITGRINVKGMLYGMRKDGSHFFNPLKLQLLIATMAIATQYVLTATSNPAAGMPPVPNEALAVIGFSNMAYLTGKAWTLLPKLISLK